ncbi:helix-turn-helix transcriptional regulator [Micromonospora sp. CPCC 206060]|uniref:helix-turn-helix domain-containing protein n=1 Tax=Micromonospora sp. CPCC 206060 TaxID=3122406 RepID=UPI002FEF29D4
MPPAVPSPILRRRRLGTELRRLREAAGLTGDQVIDRVGWASASKLSRLENGRSRPDLRDVLDLLTLYQVDDQVREELAAITREAGDMRGWLRSYPVMTQRQRSYAELEAGCAEIREYSPALVPGLLQTAAYARVRIMSTRPLNPAGDPDGTVESEDVDTEVAARLARQSLLDRAGDAPQYTAVLDEAALGRRVGPAEMLREQLNQLCDLAMLPNVTLRILPRDVPVADWYLPPTAFSLYRFADPLDPETLAIEGEFLNFMVYEREHLNRYKLVFEWLCAAALSAADSLDWLSRAAGRAGDGPTPSLMAHGLATAPTQRSRHSGHLTEH